MHKTMADTNTLPGVSPQVVNAIVDYLISSEGMHRPPEQSAKLLAFVVELYKRHQHFPARQTVAQHLGISLGTVDAALNHRLDTQHITEVRETTKGMVNKRPSVRRQKFIKPCRELVDIYDKAKRAEDRIRKQAARSV